MANLFSYLITFSDVEKFGNDLFDKTFGLLNMLPASFKAIATILLLGLACVGVIRILRHSFRLFFIILAILIVVGIILSFLK